MRFGRIPLPLAFLTWLAVSCGPAHAESLWICSLTDDAVRLVCVADIDPSEVAPAIEPTRATVHGTRFPLDPNRQWTIDLWSPPDDMDFVRLLARATVCYRSPGCRVVLDERSRVVAGLREAAGR